MERDAKSNKNGAIFAKTRSGKASKRIDPTIAAIQGELPTFCIREATI
jgi:hypothetical protein